jgi:hypothetical protein
VRKTVRYVLIVLGVVAVVAVIYDRSDIVRWVGSTNLTVEFVVTDSDTGEAIAGTEILAYPGDGYPNEIPLRLITDRDGVARWEGKRTSGGTSSGLRFTDTFSVHLPDWMLVVSAPGYQQPDVSYVNEPGGPFRGKAVETGPNHWRLVVPIALRKSEP